MNLNNARRYWADAWKAFTNELKILRYPTLLMLYFLNAMYVIASFVLAGMYIATKVHGSAWIQVALVCSVYALMLAVTGILSEPYQAERARINFLYYEAIKKRVAVKEQPDKPSDEIVLYVLAVCNVLLPPLAIIVLSLIALRTGTRAYWLEWIFLGVMGISTTLYWVLWVRGLRNKRRKKKSNEPQ